jgi:predicted transcriptional regulator
LKRRPSVLIYMRILEEVRREPRGPTRLAQAVNLSYDKFVPFLQTLVAKGLLKGEESEGREVYSITAEGIQTFLHWEMVWEKIRP